ncbi:MAG: efflux RND transporter permease subunit, partial [Elusimicrobia bacterium]|nr:efflux RND transporter permease subunit [Elusimicrobiota bacterium]
PLAVAGGSGGIARQAMGTCVIGGMLAATGIAIFLIPMLYHVLEGFSERRRGSGGAAGEAKAHE